MQIADIREADFTVWRGHVDILTGGFPCQPFSSAGKRQGTEDDRHLWPEMLRAIREIKPQWVVGENVGGIVNWNEGLVFEQVQANLEAEGYEIQTFILPASGVNAPHRRDRTWFVAYSKSHNDRGEQRKSGKRASDTTERGAVWGKLARNGYKQFATNTNKKRQSSERQSAKLGSRGFSEYNAQSDKPDWQNFPTQSPVCGGNDGLPSRLDGITFPRWRRESLKAYGNAVVPQVAFEIFKAVEETLNQNP